MRYQFNPPQVKQGDLKSEDDFRGDLVKHLRKSTWKRGHLFVVTLDAISSDPPVVTVPSGGAGGQDDGAQPTTAAGGGLSADQANGAFSEGDTIHYVEVPSRLEAIRFSMHRVTEASEQDGHVQVRVRDWVGEKWVGPVLSSLEGELGRGETVRVDEDLEPGAELGGVYARVGRGPAYHPSRGTLHLLIALR